MEGTKISPRRVVIVTVNKATADTETKIISFKNVNKEPRNKFYVVVLDTCKSGSTIISIGGFLQIIRPAN